MLIYRGYFIFFKGNDMKSMIIFVGLLVASGCGLVILLAETERHHKEECTIIIISPSEHKKQI